MPILLVFVCLAFMELVIVHWLVSLWSPSVASTLSALTALVLLHIALLIRAMMLRPIVVSDQGVTVRCGVATAIFLPIGTIELLEDTTFAPAPRGPSVLRGTVLAHPNIALRLRAPQALRRLGRERLIDRISLRLDEPEAFRAAVEGRRAASTKAAGLPAMALAKAGAA